MTLIYEPRHEKMYIVCDQHGSRWACTSVQSNQDPYCLRQVSVTFTGSDSKQYGSWWDCADALAHLDPCWWQTHYVRFLVARLIYIIQNGILKARAITIIKNPANGSFLTKIHGVCHWDGFSFMKDGSVLYTWYWLQDSYPLSQNSTCNCWWKHCNHYLITWLTAISWPDCINLNLKQLGLQSLQNKVIYSILFFHLCKNVQYEQSNNTNM